MEIAVLQVKFDNIEDKVGELKADVKDVRDALEKHSEDQMIRIKDMQNAAEIAHKSLSNKISHIEKWRWMMMGAGIVIGSLGYDTIAKLLK